jgi:hypothetical protein
MSPQTNRLISVDLLTPSFRIVGKVVVESSGLAGQLNNPDTSFLEIIDAHLARIHMPTKLASRFDVLRMNKERIFAICVQRQADLGPRRLVQGGFQDINTYRIHLATPIYELNGDLEVPGRFNFAALMVEGKRDFIPLYNVHLVASLIPSMVIESEAILFNRNQVDWIGLEKDRIKE